MKLREGYDRFRLTGEMSAFLIDPKTNKIVDERHVENLIVDAGEIWMAELLAKEFLDGSVMSYAAGKPGYGIQYVHVGEGTTAAAYGDTYLGSPVSATWYTATTNDVSGNGNILVFRGTYSTSGGNGSITEAGLFCSTASSGYTETSHNDRMYNRTTFPVITKTTYFELAIQWTITIGSYGA